MARGATGLDEALDELYASSPSEFTAKRDALAKKLKAAGEADAAQALKARRKPTQIAYVLNQLARKHADELAELVDVGRELARAQRKALRGEAGHDLRDAIARQRKVVAELTGKTASLMSDLGVSPSGHLDEIAGALQAALVDPAVGAVLEDGRLEKVPETVAGFPGAAVEHGPVEIPAKPDGHAKKKAAAHAKKEKLDAHAKAEARAKAEADERARAKARAEEQAREEEKRAAAAAAQERERLAEAAEREADGHAAQAKKLDDEARALDTEAKRLAAEAKRIAREAVERRRAADQAAKQAARAEAAAKRARTEAKRASRDRTRKRAR